MSAAKALDRDAGDALLALYDASLPDVYGYLLRRCGDRGDAEDLTTETFLAAATSLRSGDEPAVGVAWLIGIARHKLIDHWRRQERDQRNLRAVTPLPVDANDPWEAELDAAVARQVLCGLAPAYRSALTLRYLDDLPVPQVAAVMARSLHATESLLVRARAAFKYSYLAIGGAL